MRTRLLLAAFALASLAGTGDAEEGESAPVLGKVVPKSGKPVRGTVFREGAQVRVNPYRSRVAAMTWGVVRFPADGVKRVEEEKAPEEEVLTKHRALAKDDVAGRVALAKEARAAKLDADAERLLEEALAIDPAHAEALALYGGATKFAARRRGDPALDRDLEGDLRKWLLLEDGAERAKEAKRIEAERGFPAKAEYLERVWKSQRAPKGTREDAPITLRSDKHPGGVYTIVVPESYDPLVPTPLVLGLHGGGPGGKARDLVVGSGREAMSLYQGGISKTGWILVCPTALAAPWSATGNEPFLLSVLEEVTAFYNVDLDRVHLTGHSMGGFGSWWFGPRHVDVFATVSPTAGGGPGGTKDLTTARTGVFVFHGTDDPVVGVGGSREGAKALLEAGADVVYLELDKEGHGFPPAAHDELFQVMERHRLFDPKRKSAWPRSSFHRKVSADEKRYLGDPAEGWTGGAEDANLKDLVAAISQGGGTAEKAVRTVAEKKPEGAAKAIAKVLRNPKATDDARAYAARALGLLKDPAGLDALKATVAGEGSSRLARETATALRLLGSPDAAPALDKALGVWAGVYAGKLEGEKIQYEDFEGVCGALGDLVEALAVCAPEEAPAILSIDRHAVKSVLGAGHEIQATERAGQNPSLPRTRLSESVARALATLGAPEAAFESLRAAVSKDERAVAAIATGRESPLPRSK